MLGRSVRIVSLVAGLALLSWSAPPAAALQGQGPKCDFVFCRNAKRVGKVVVCFTRQDRTVQLVCIVVDGVVDPVPPGAPTTPAEMATAMCNAVNAQPGLMCTNPGPGIVCVMAKMNTSPIKMWTVRQNDGTGGLIKDVGPGPTNPINPGGPPPPPPPGVVPRPPRVQLKGMPVSPATLDLQAHGGPVVSTPIPIGTPMSVAAQQAVANLNAAGYRARYLGVNVSSLGDLVAEIELVSLPLGGGTPRKLVVLSYDELTPGPSTLSIGCELKDATKAQLR
jgi:hypothetical protein